MEVQTAGQDVLAEKAVQKDEALLDTAAVLREEAVLPAAAAL